MSHATQPSVSQLRHIHEFVSGDTWEDYIDANYAEGQFRHVDEYRLAKAHAEDES